MYSLDDFKKDFPNADLQYFEADFDTIFYKFPDGNDYSIESDTFWRHQEAVAHLNLTGNDVYWARVWRDKFPKAKRIIAAEKKKMMREFVLKYPAADIKDYNFEVLLNDDLTVKSKNIYHQSSSDKNDFHDISKPSFNTDILYWKPRIWSTGGTEIRPYFEENNFKISSFDIVVDSVSKSSFPSNFPKLNTTWSNTSKTNDITTQSFDITDPYFASLAASYNTFCTTGFSLQHLNSEDLFVKSICNYYVYYWMSVFLRSPKTVPDNIKKYLKENHPIKKVWTKEFHQGSETPSYWMVKQPEWKTHRIRNARPVFAKERRFGQVGISYEKVTYIGPRGEDDWKDLIPKESKGLTKQGENMFQQCLESLVFCVLDAQAKTGWSITEQGAKSYQTQDVFRKLVQDTIVQHDVTVTISNMKRAIVDTGVSLNFAIVPKTILIPSDMRLQTKIPGFNNILTLVRGSMHFGKNSNINVRESNPVRDPQTSSTKQTSSDTKQTSEKHPDSYYREQKTEVSGSKEREGVKVEIIGGVVAGLFLRLLMWLV